MDYTVWHDARTWKEMHPGDQRVMSHADFARCESGPLQGSHVRVEVIRVRRRAIRFEEIPQLSAERVWMRVSYRVRHTDHIEHFPWYVDVVRVKNRWRWILDEGTVESVRANPGSCPE